MAAVNTSTSSGPPAPLRIGILGAARIAPGAVIQPIKDNADLLAKAQIVCFEHTRTPRTRADLNPALPAPNATLCQVFLECPADAGASHRRRASHHHCSIVWVLTCAAHIIMIAS